MSGRGLRLRGGGDDPCPPAVDGEALLRAQLGVGAEASSLSASGADLFYVPSEEKPLQWPGAASASGFVQQMGLIGDADVLQRDCDCLCVGGTNVGGGVVPYTKGGAVVRECRLKYGLALIENGVLDMYAILEAHIDKSCGTRIRRFIRRHGYRNIVAKMAFTSRAMSAIEAGQAGVNDVRSLASGAILLLPIEIAAALIEVHDYVSGRILETSYATEHGTLYVILLYAVSSPTRDAVKRKLNSTVCAVLTGLLAKLRGKAVLVFADLNVVADGIDRVHGEMLSYDLDIGAIWRVLARAGLRDVHRLRRPQERDYTFLRREAEISRIDGWWTSPEVQSWPGGGLQGLRTAITRNVAPLSADHRTPLARIPGSFPWVTAAGAGVVAVTVAPRPAHAPMTVENAEAYKVKIAAHAEQLADAETQLRKDVGDWPAISTAIERLGLQDAYTHNEVLDALRQRAAIEGEAERQSAEYAADLLLHQGPGFDGAGRRRCADDAVNAYLDAVLPIWRGASEDKALSKQSSRHSRRPGVSPSQARSLLDAWRAYVDRRDTETWAGVCSSAQDCGLTPPAPEATIQEIHRWAEGSAEVEGALDVAERLHALQGGVWTAAGWIGADLGALPEGRPVTLTLEEHFEVFKGRDGAGAIDTLLVADTETGELLPETLHDNLAAHVQATMQEWTRDKAYGGRTFALTANASAVLYENWYDRRGYRRARVRSAAGVATMLEEVTTRLDDFARMCQTPMSGLAALLESADSVAIRPSAVERAALQYMELSSQRKQLACDYALRMAPSTERALRAALVGAVAQATHVAMPRGPTRVREYCGCVLVLVNTSEQPHAEGWTLGAGSCLENPFRVPCARHGHELVAGCQLCGEARATSARAFCMLLCDAGGEDGHTHATTAAVAQQLGLTGYVDAGVVSRAPDAGRVSALQRLYGLVRILPRVTLLSSEPTELTHAPALASWLLAEWDSPFLRQLRLTVQARTAHVQPPLGQAGWLHGEQLEVCADAGEFAGIYLQARYLSGQEAGHLVELLMHQEQPPCVFAESLLSPLPPPPPAGWHQQIAAGCRVQVQRQLGYAAATVTKVIMARDVLKWACRIASTAQEVTVTPHDTRPMWKASLQGAFEYEHATGRCSVQRLLIQPGTRVRITGRHQANAMLIARVGTAVVAVGLTDWYVRLDGDAWQQQHLLPVTVLQAVAPPPELL